MYESAPKSDASLKCLFSRYFLFSQFADAQARLHVVAQASLNFGKEKI